MIKHVPHTPTPNNIQSCRVLPNDDDDDGNVKICTDNEEEEKLFGNQPKPGITKRFSVFFFGSLERLKKI